MSQPITEKELRRAIREADSLSQYYFDQIKCMAEILSDAGKQWNIGQYKKMSKTLEQIITLCEMGSGSINFEASRVGCDHQEGNHE